MTNVELKKTLVEILSNNNSNWFKIGQLSLKCFEGVSDFSDNRSIYRQRVYKCLNYLIRIGIVEKRQIAEYTYKWKSILPPVQS